MNRNVRLDLETNELNDEQLAKDLHTELKARRQDSFDDLLKQNKIEHEYNRPQSGARYARMLNADREFVPFEEADENLGENFESTPWIPPTVEKAKVFKRESIFRNGDARIDSVELVSAPDLGIGTSLYFQFAMTMAICLFVMSLMSLPALIFVFNGSAIPLSDQDVLGLYKYTLGNIGYDRSASNFDTESKCKDSRYAANDICLHINGNELSMTDAASLLTAMEFLQIVVFFIGVLYIYRSSISVTGKTAKSTTCISDYTIMVTGIPQDTSDEEIIEHFNKLYKLNERDFKQRPALEEAQPVDNTDYSNTPNLRNSWIAECIIHKGIGGFISAFKSKEHVLQRLYRSRARMKMYAENTSHAGGYNENLFKKAEKEMLHTSQLIDKLTAHNLKKTKLRFIDYNKEHHKKKINSNPENIYYNIDAEAVAAFITFEYAESFARCVRDYEKYTAFPMNLLYPEHLKFRGQKIKVIKAPEPDQIVWENLEVATSKKLYLRFRTNSITLVLVVACFIIILQASIYKSLFSSQIPDGKMCTTTIPLVYANGSDYNNFEIVRPSGKTQKTLDASCAATIRDTFYAIYTDGGDFDKPVVDYDLSACESDASGNRTTQYERHDQVSSLRELASRTDGLCPVYGAETFCPCVSLKSSTDCDGGFPAKDIGACFCYSQLDNVIRANGIAGTLNRINQLGTGICRSFFQQYSVSVGLTYTSVFVTIVVNVLLRRFLKYLARQEAHTSSDAEQGSILSKIFLSNYITMAIIVLVAYGKAANLPAFFKAIRIFNGVYDDFTTAWYGNIGFYLMTTFILQSFSPLLANILMYILIKPAQRWFHHKRVSENRSHNMVMQHDLNMLEVGPIFDPTDHTAQLLTLLFFAMTYAPGLPLLMPLCCFAFVLYFRVDKILLCRYYQRPPQVGDAAIRNVLFFLPLAAIVRLAFACWMFGNQDILPTTESGSSAAYNKFLKDIRDSSGTYSYARDRLFTPNTFPLFCLFLLIVAAVVIKKMWRELPIFWIFKIFNQVKHLFKQADIFAKQTEEGTISAWDLLKLDDPLRQQVSGLTKDYFRYVKHRDEIPDTCFKMFSYAYLTQMSEIEVDEGWKIEDRGDFVVKVKIWREEHRRSDGTKVRVGTLKRTYEVVADHRCNSYNIEKVPAYYLPMRGIREGAYIQGVGGGDFGLEEGRESDKHFLYDHQRSVDMDEAAALSLKDKKPPAHHSNKKGQVVVDASSPAPTAPLSNASAPQKTGTGRAKGEAKGGGDRNFTFDDFEGMEQGESTALTEALAREQQEKEKEKERKKHEAEGKKKKKGKKTH